MKIRTLSMRLVGRIQRLLLILGLLLIGIYVAAYIHMKIISRAELRRFENQRTETHVDTAETLLPESGFKFGFSLWSKKRIVEFEDSLARRLARPVAVLRISKVHLEVPVLEGTDDLTLNRGVGHIPGTGQPGSDGNIGIAGHRDSFFRVLKDIGPGDMIDLQTPRGTDKYRVDQITLVRPNDVSILQPRSTRSLTLVTCYPFYFIGSAPQRYIVQASITDSDRGGVGSVTKLRTLEH
jgi:sortase A